MRIIFLLKCWGPAPLFVLLALMFFEHVCSTETTTCLSVLKFAFWQGVFLSHGIGNFTKLRATRRLCNRKIISLLAAVPASTSEPSFPFGLCSDWSEAMQPECSWVQWFHAAPLLESTLVSAMPGGMVIAASHLLMKQGKALVYPWPWRSQLRVFQWGTSRFDLTWPDLTGVGLGQNRFPGCVFWWLLSRASFHSTVKGTKQNQRSVLAV